MNINGVVLLLLILLLVGGFPAWGWHSLGYWPSGLFGLLLLILILKLLGVI